jgi:hypothetical protein
VAVQVKTYTVHAVRGQGWWGLTVPEVPGAVSQVRSLASAEECVREAIAFVAGLDPGSFAVEVVPQLPGSLAEEVAQAVEEHRDARLVSELVPRQLCRPASEDLPDAPCGLSHELPARAELHERAARSTAGRP